MREVTGEWLDFLREQYPVGSRIQLSEMGSDPRPILPGTMGTLKAVDDLGTFHVKWDNGRELGVVIGKDRFTVHPPEPTLLKLYMPLTADFYPRDEWGDTSEEGEEWDGRTLLEYKDQIVTALFKYRISEEQARGLMRWYGKQDSLNAKVVSARFTVDDHNGQLWGVAECQMIDELSPQELDQLKGFLAGQASDGWGEGFEQREITVDGGDLYVHFWSDDNWSIQSEHERFGPDPETGWPEKCFSTLPSTGQLICIKRGESGYYPSRWDTGNRAQNEELADKLNENLGVTPTQRQAMEIGSMAGWDVPGADPRHYEVQEEMDPNFLEDNSRDHNHDAIQIGGF